MASSSTPQPTAEERFAELFPEVAEESARFKREFQPSGVIEWGVSHLEHGVSHLAPTAARLGRSCKAQANAKNATATAAAASAAAAAAAATAAEADDWSVWMRIEASAAAAAAAVALRGSVRRIFREREANDALRLEAASQQSRVVDNPEEAPAAAIAVRYRDGVRGEQLFTASGISITIPHDVPDAGLASYFARIEEEECRSQLSERAANDTCVWGDVEENVVVDNPEAATAAAAEAALVRAQCEAEERVLAAMHATSRAQCEAEERVLAAMHATSRAQCEAEERLSELRDQQARVDWHNDAALAPSPWSDMDETSCRVGNPAGSVIRFPFAVDERLQLASEISTGSIDIVQ
jgi:hypothetical protein